MWGGQCGGCLESIEPFIHGAREDVERELVEVRGRELVEPDQVWCTGCSRRAREVKQHDQRGRRRR